jgi:hypothetical protein
MLRSSRVTALPALGLASALALSPGLAQALDRHIALVNHTSHTVTSFYATSVEEAGCEEDILGNEVLRPGQRLTIDFTDGRGSCRYDFKAVLDNGASLIRRNVDVCSVSTFTIDE